MNMVDMDDDDVEEIVIPDKVEKSEEIKLDPIVDTSDDLGYWEISDLPTKGYLYPKDTKIRGRRLEVKEIKKLAQANDENREEIQQQIIKSAVKGIDVDELYDDDKLYIIIWLRANSYKEPGYGVTFYCTKCESISTYEFQLDQVKIKYLDKDFVSNIKLTNGDNIETKFLQVKDVNKIEKFKKNYPDVEIDDDFLDIAILIKTINGENLDLMNKYLYVSSKLSTELYSQLNTKINKYNFGVSSSIEVECTNCKEVVPTDIVFHQAFFLPRYIL